MSNTPEQQRSVFTAALTKNLNPEQRSAVLMDKSSALVLAGAGSGKTTVIIGRVANLVNEGLVPQKIMVVTFTNKASEEVKHRLRDKMPREAVAAIWAGTFHSICNRILRESFEEAGLPRNFAILDTDGQESLIRQLTKDANNAIVVPEGEDGEKLAPKDVVKYINVKKEAGVRPMDIDAEPGTEEGIMVELYGEYQRSCAEQGLLDFNDLLYKTVDLLEKNDTLRTRYQDKFDSLLVDEFQDTNDIQYRWLQLIKGPNSFVMAVGDDDQSIYAFRGARPENMQRFVDEMTVSADHPDGNVIKLERNYRSLPYILESANAVIERNTDRLGKNLRTDRQDRGEKIVVTTFEDGVGEAASIAGEIHNLVKNQGVPPHEISILYRTNMQSRLLEQELNKLGVPLTVYGGFRFFERQEIKHVLAYMDLVSSFSRDISFARVVNFPLRGIGEVTVEDLRQEAKANNVSMIEMIALRSEKGTAGMTASAQKKKAALEDFAGLIMDMAEVAPTLQLAELISHVVEKSGLGAHYATLSKEESAERMENINELISAAKQFEIDRPDLNGALEQLPEYLSFVQLMTSTSEADMDRKNTVSLMTVHSAKGLEFDNVFVAGLEEGTFPHSRSLEASASADAASAFEDTTFGVELVYNDRGDLTDECLEAIQIAREKKGGFADSPEIQEERRLMYVALTRARKVIKLSRAKKRMLNGKDVDTKPSRFLAEIPEHRVAHVKDTTQARSYGNYGKGGQPNRWAKKPVASVPLAAKPAAPAVSQPVARQAAPAPTAVARPTVTPAAHKPTPPSDAAVQQFQQRKPLFRKP